MQDTLTKFLDKHEAAELTGFSARYLDYQRARGALPFYRLGARAVRFKERDVLAFMEKFRVDAGRVEC